MCVIVIQCNYCIFVNNKQPYDGCYPRDPTHASMLLSLTADGRFVLVSFLLLVFFLVLYGKMVIINTLNTITNIHYTTTTTQPQQHHH